MAFKLAQDHGHHVVKGTSWIAEYTAYHWVAHGLSNDAFSTPRGRLVYTVLQPFVKLIEYLGDISLSAFLLQRHLIINALLESEIQANGPSIVLEIGAGYSGRGYRFMSQFGPEILAYVEADLPAVIYEKEAMLARLPSVHRPKLAICDISSVGFFGLDALADRLQTEKRHLVVVTEGLIDYLSLQSVTDLWSRLATVCRRFETATYLTDITPRNHHDASEKTLKMFTSVLRKLVREPLTRPFSSDLQVEISLKHSGFDAAEIVNPSLSVIDMPPKARVGRCVARIARAQISR